MRPSAPEPSWPEHSTRSPAATAWEKWKPSYSGFAAGELITSMAMRASLSGGSLRERAVGAGCGCGL